jgi:AraC-like DNA-binding protein
MKKAIQYAKSGAKMYLTASEVGIPDPNYFSRCFKKYTGMSYSEYVISCAGKQNKKGSNTGDQINERENCQA